MALCKKLRPGDYVLLLDGGAVRNITSKSIEIILLSPTEALAQKIKEQIQLTNPTKGPQNEKPVK